MKSFLHESSAFEDEKVYQLYLKYGYKGIGIFYVILEKLALQEKPIKETIIKSQMNLTKREDEIINYMAEIDLIQRENNEISNENLMNYISSYVEQRKKSAKRMRQSRNNQQVSENVTENNSRSYASNTNTNTNTNTIETKDEKFEIFWKVYDKKNGRNLAIAQWNNLTEEDKDKIFGMLPEYIENNEQKYRRDPHRFLSLRTWEDEVIFKKRKSSDFEKTAVKKNNEIIIPEDF